MSERNDLLLLKDIENAGTQILVYCRDITYEEFMRDEKTQDACIRKFEIMGEAARRISEELKMEDEKIPWKNISNYRNLLIHEYFGVNLDIVWDIIDNELAETLKRISRIIENR